MASPLSPSSLLSQYSLKNGFSALPSPIRVPVLRSGFSVSSSLAEKHGIYCNRHYKILCHSSSSSMTKRKRTKYRKQYPGESVGITEEMRFVAMRLRNLHGKKLNTRDSDEKEQVEEEEGETWRASKEGLLKYLVDSKLVFDTIERIVDESEDVSYAYFRRTGLERCRCLENDLQWFATQNIAIPEPSHVGVSYANYLKEQAEEDAPLFLSHFYSIYFSHIAGGQVIVRKVCEELLDGKELEFNKWEGEAHDLLRGVREKVNVLGEHWTRDDKNKCLKETAKAFKYMGQIVRLIVL